MSGWKQSLRHAFAVERPEDFAPTDEQARLVDAIARAVARKGMTTPLEMLLHVGHPYNYITSQTMHFFRPVASGLLWVFAPFLPKSVNAESYRALSEMLEHRGALQYIQQRIEHHERECQRLEAERKR